MDVKIENNDIAVLNNGDFEYISGMDEVLQRVKIACSLKKGDFRYDGKLGRFNDKIDFSDEMVCEKLTMIFKEATVDVGYTDLSVLSVENINSVYIAKVLVKCFDKTATTEVSLYE